ncbi:MAG: hypothetical protein EPN92_08965 [Chitinophagaceae bacterium]|nr:MAG: hypothetical protein EPN92_08965 [Chitinophagaceae bacterium]
MNDQSFLSGTKISTIGGTLTIIFLNINAADIVKTVIMATIGATVSYTISVLIRKLVSWWKSRKG